MRSPLTTREVLLAGAAAVVVAVVMTWPLVLDLGDVVPRDIGDPLAIAWQPAWGGHALNQPLEFFDSNRFWPIPDSLAFGDALIGYAPAGMIGDGPEEAIVRYDILFIFSYALAFFGAYLLAREIGIGPAGAAVAGVAFAFAPFRLEQDGHMQVIASGGIPLSLAFAARGIRLGQPWWVFCAWLVAAWQVSLGSFSVPLRLRARRRLRGCRDRLARQGAPVDSPSDAGRRDRRGNRLRRSLRGNRAPVPGDRGRVPGGEARGERGRASRVPSTSSSPLPGRTSSGAI